MESFVQIDVRQLDNKTEKKQGDNNQNDRFCQI